MVRVAGLKRRIAAGITPVRASGLDAKQVLELITSRAKRLTAAQAELFQMTYAQLWPRQASKLPTGNH